MNIFRQLLIAVVLMFGIALNVSAQKDNQNRPPKTPPTIPVPPKDPPKGNPPRDDDRDRPKKPESYFSGLSGEIISN